MGAKDNISSYYKSSRKGTTKKKNKENGTKASNLPDNINFAAAWDTYHLDYSKCELHPPSKPRTRNCHDNPYCIHRIGLEKWQKLKPKKVEVNSTKKPRRDIEKQPCGLENVGNYCYVNSFLQIWFNDLVFRQCVYDWVPLPDFKTEARFNVQAIMNYLQELFITLHITPFEKYNPKAFCELLKLDNEQNDVQEFTIMFFDVLLRHLEDHPNGKQTRELIRNRIEGKQKQTIVCTCGKLNESDIEFRTIQLIIEGCKTLNEAFDKSHQDEELSDYKCDNCQQKGNVKRKTEISALPPVLLFTLNRYVFDQQGRNKKLTFSLQYPRTLNEKFLNPNAKEDRIYELCAVGQNAHCGHYYDLIKDPISGQWFTYNDTEVKSQKSAPGFVGDLKSTKPPPDTKGCYGLIYRRVDAIGSISDIRIPSNILNPIEKRLNDLFIRESNEGDNATNIWYSQIEQRASYLENIWEELEVSKGKDMKKFPNDIAFLPTKLLIEIQKNEYKSVEEMKEISAFLPTEEKQNHENRLTRLQNEAYAKDELNQEFIDRLYKTEKESAIEKIDVDSTSSLNGYGKNDKSILLEDNLAIADFIYMREPIEDTQIRLCGHGKISLEAVLKGEIKAVNRIAAEKLLENYQIGLDLRNSNEVIDLTADKKHTYELTKLFTGNDICIDCILYMKSDENFQKELEEKINMVNEITKQKYRFVFCLLVLLIFRIHDPCKDVPMCEVPPPEGSVWCSVKSLNSYRKLANQQFDYNRSFRVSPKSQYFSLNTPGFKKGVRSSSRSVSASTPIVNSCAMLNIKDNRRKRRKADRFGMPTDRSDRAFSDGEESSNKKALVNSRGASTIRPSRLRSISETGSIREDIREGVSTSMETDHSKSFDAKKEEGTPDHASVNGVLTNSNESSEEKMEVDTTSNLNMDEALADSKKCLQNGSGDSSKESLCTKQLEPVIFNDDLKCQHDGLTFEVKRIWLLQDEWDKLVDKIFPMYNLVPTDEQECILCSENYFKTENMKTIYSEKINQLNAVVGKFLRTVEKRSYMPEQLGTDYTRVLCGKFPSNFIKSYNSRVKDKIPEICQECLLCEDHLKPYKFLEQPDSLAVTKDEWEILVDAYRQAVPDQSPPTEIVLTKEGILEDFCDDCHAVWGISEESKRYNYSDGNIYKKDEADDGNKFTTERRTTRRAASRDLINVKMSSTETIIMLKCRLYEKTSQYSPADQILFKGTVELDNEQTLEDAKVAANNPDDPLILIVQQRMDSSNEPRPLEKGFKGSALSYV